MAAFAALIAVACSSADEEEAPAAPAAAAPAAAAPAAPAAAPAAKPAAAPAPAAPAAKPTAVPEKPVQGVTTAPKKLSESKKVVETTGGPENGGTLRVVLTADPGSKWDMCECVLM